MADLAPCHLLFPAIDSLDQGTFRAIVFFVCRQARVDWGAMGLILARRASMIDSAAMGMISSVMVLKFGTLFVSSLEAESH